MASDMLNLSINKEMLTPVIEQQVKLLMCEIMGGQDVIIDKVISQVLNTKVDSDGKPSTYSSGTKPFFEYLLTKQISEAVQECLKEELSQKTEVIKKKVKNYLRTDKGATKIADSLLKGWMECLESGWRSEINVSVSRQDY